MDDDSGEEELALNLAPMIDVVFLLLVFFMVATTFVDPERSLDLELPPAESGAEPRELPDELMIEVRRDGTTSIAGTPYDADGLRAELERVARIEASTPVSIRGDRAVEYWRVVSVLDLCHGVGLTDAGLMVEESTP
ncbi:MAG: biopolymer transporter ExbD [Planctomycetota bacterium]